MEMPKRTPALADKAAALSSAARMNIFVFICFYLFRGALLPTLIQTTK
jgi:hypothetical protein